MLLSNFMIFGTLRVDWPKKLPTCEAPPNGYAFLVFDTENGVKNLMNACFFSENRYIYTIVTAKQLQHPVGFSISHNVLICFFPLKFWENLGGNKSLEGKGSTTHR